MASKALLMMMLIAIAVAPALGTDYMVGWTLDVNYTQWAAGLEFHVGDTLTFMYNPADHNVLSVTGADFKTCNTSAPLKGPFNSGNDTFALSAPGKKWYICAIAGHCDAGMKLVINIAAEGPAPAPGPSSAAGEVTLHKFFLWMVAAVTAAFWMVVA